MKNPRYITIEVSKLDEILKEALEDALWDDVTASKAKTVKEALIENNATKEESSFTVTEFRYAPIQKCPKCDGQGLVSKPPFIAGDVYEWSSSSGAYQCDVCNGSKVIPMAQYPINPPLHEAEEFNL